MERKANTKVYYFTYSTQLHRVHRAIIIGATYVQYKIYVYVYVFRIDPFYKHRILFFLEVAECVSIFHNKFSTMCTIISY